MKPNELLDSILSEGTMKEPEIPMDWPVSAETPTLGVHQTLSQPDMLKRVNAFLCTLTYRPYINPFSAMQVLHDKLRIGGIEFKDPKMESQYGRESLPIKQWGKPTDYSLSLTWVEFKGWYTLAAEIVKNDASEESITESADEFGQMCEAAKEHGFTLLSVLGNGSHVYTSTQGHKLHIKQHALHGASFSSTTSANERTAGSGLNTLAKHLAFINGNQNKYHGKYKFNHF